MILEGVFLPDCSLNNDGIWCDDKIYINSNQVKEHQYRTDAANKFKGDYFDNLSNYYSIQVMDSEVSRTLNDVPKNGLILDIGGAWGWHWRNLSSQRADVTVLIVDFVYENLMQAKELLSDYGNNNIHFLYADATQMPIRNEMFNLVWAVQSFQHIPDISSVLLNAKRVLCLGGTLKTYDFNYRLVEKTIYRIFGRQYEEKEELDSYFLRRSGPEIKSLIFKTFQSKIKSEYTEILFQPNFKVIYKKGSLMGKLDCFLSGHSFFVLIARQKTLICKKTFF